MKCIKCGNELTVDMFASGMCFECGTPVTQSEKMFHEQLKKEESQKAAELQKLESERKEKLLQMQEGERNDFINRLNNHMLTTGLSFEGYNIIKYLGLVSGDIVMGTGFISSISASISDMFGVNSIEYSNKIKLAKEQAIADMIQCSTEKGANAIIGISFQITSFSNDLIGVSVSGTSVLIGKSN